MCVIYYARSEDKRPPLEELKAGEVRNSDGAGYAYFQYVGGKPLPHFKRGQDLSAEEIFHDLKRIRGPILIHFRTASVGPKCEALTHPFELAWEQTEEREGVAPNGLLMQNGTWSGWKSALVDAVRIAAGRLKLPPEKEWNDGKVMAALGGLYGAGYLDMADIGYSRLGIMLPPSPQFPNGYVYPLGTGWERGVGGWLQSSSTGPTKVVTTTWAHPHASSASDERSKRQKEVDEAIKKGVEEKVGDKKTVALATIPKVEVIRDIPNTAKHLKAKIRKLGVQVAEHPNVFTENELLNALAAIENEKISIRGLEILN